MPAEFSIKIITHTHIYIYIYIYIYIETLAYSALRQLNCVDSYLSSKSRDAALSCAKFYRKTSKNRQQKCERATQNKMHRHYGVRLLRLFTNSLFRTVCLGCPRSAMLIMGPHWCYIACIGILFSSIKPVTPVEINVSMS